MQTLDEMSMNDAIILCYEKHYALQQGDMMKLLELKKKCPEIFDKAKEAEILEVIKYAQDFQKTPRYRELQLLLVKEKLSVITNDSMDV